MSNLISNVLFSTKGGLPLLIARLTLAAVMFPHGAQKALGMFGGAGWSGTMGFFTSETLGLPWVVAALVILIEFVGPLLLAVGFLARPAAIGLIAVMVGAIQKVHLANGFFMNWFGAQEGEGYEYHLLVIGLAAAVLVGGAGSLSVDAGLAGSRSKSA